VRSAALINQEIRELASRVARTDAERARMAELWAEWQLADQAENNGRAA
jgi:hypothetical protein